MKPLGVLVCTSLVAATAVAEITDTHRSAAARAFSLGESLAREQRFAEAATQFANAFQILDSRQIVEPDDARAAGDYLYGWAQAERLAGNCACAIALYDEFRRFARVYFADSQNWPRKAEDGIAACPAVAPDRSRCRAPALTAPLPVAPGATTTRRDHARSADGVTVALAISGTLAAASGAWLVHDGVQRADDARAPGVSYADYVELADSANLRARLGWSLVGVGALALGGAALRYATSARHARLEPVVDVRPRPSELGATIGVSGTF
jgi:hypothetical protein